ncbi:MAG: 4-alpha-glucanotransferase [Clostridiales bacterium]|nr:4-alpha-glucanotransferase [Clostridiales bacterium]
MSARKNGILMPISALPGSYGIGCFSKEAYEFVDALEAAGQAYWQILPLGPTGYGDSPYQSFSTFAGNPYFIDLMPLIKEGLLTESECDDADFGADPCCIDYEKLYNNRFNILSLAYFRAKALGAFESEEFKTFCEKEQHWLPDYALFMAIKDHHGGRSWQLWEPNLRFRVPEALAEQEETLHDQIEYYRFLQFLFSYQWRKLKSYANEKGIDIIGDIPIYVAYDSADTWAEPDLFRLDEANLPRAVAGCPPDAFSPTGQLWGNPLYAWGRHKKSGYAWWVKRVEHCFDIYDMVRIDHFRGFDEYYAIPYGDKTAENGRWMPGPGMDVFNAIRERLGDVPIIAEDLGFLTDTVRALLKESGYPGMKVLQFAFDSREESDYLPHNYGRNCVVYTGTHDNDTTVGWFKELAADDKQLAVDYLNITDSPEEKVNWDFIALAMRSVADICIIPLQDVLSLGSEARINTPSTLGGNWAWRMKEGALTEEMLAKLKRLTRITGRMR